MKRFLVFSGWDYYASGGWFDFKQSFETSQEATAYVEGLMRKPLGEDWFQIVDTTTNTLVTRHISEALP